MKKINSNKDIYMSNKYYFDLWKFRVGQDHSTKI